MARARNPNREKAKEIWLVSGGTKKLKDIAEELGCSDSQVRKWKSQDKWDEEVKKNVPNDNSNVTNEKERYKSAKGNKNAKGNSGNSNAKPPSNNKNAIKHGLFAKWLPEETIEIMETISQSEPADILWNNIMIQYTAIIRSQQIMYVGDSNDISKEESGWSSGESVRSATMQVQYAWDKQANFLAAQSRAMATLSNLIKQFTSIADETDERRAKLELMTAQMEKTKADAQLSQLKVEALKNGTSQTTEDKLDELLDTIVGDLNGTD